MHKKGSMDFTGYLFAEFALVKHKNEDFFLKNRFWDPYTSFPITAKFGWNM